jgi:hypothetical protein
MEKKPRTGIQYDADTERRGGEKTVETGAKPDYLANQNKIRNCFTVSRVGLWLLLLSFVHAGPV